MEWDYDAADRVLEHRRVGTDDSEITLAATTYDLAGRTLSTLDALDNETTYAYVYPVGGGMTTTVTHPDGGTVVRSTVPGGDAKETGGTAAAPVKSQRGVWSGGEWTRQIRIGAGGSETEWVQSFTDLAGRTVRTGFPDTSFATMAYDSLGRLVTSTDPDGIVTAMEYDVRGRQSARIIAPGTADERRTEMEYGVATAHATTVERVTTSVFDGATAVAVSIDESATDGRSRWSIRAGATTSSASTPPDGGDWMEASTAPGGETTVRDYVGGLLSQITYPDGRTETYAYDAHLRLSSVTDSRTGATSFTYDNRDQMLTSTSPAAGGGGTPLVSANTYDSMGRVTATDAPDTLDADGNPLANITRTSYHPTGQVKAQWDGGISATYRAYDPQNRPTELRTYRGLAHGTEPTAATAGADTTTWVYDSQRGFMIRKEHADGKGTDYTHTAGSRIHTRTWARGVVTTYGYNSAGELALTDYSDATPDVAVTYTSFGGQGIRLQRSRNHRLRPRSRHPRPGHRNRQLRFRRGYGRRFHPRH